MRAEQKKIDGHYWANSSSRIERTTRKKRRSHARQIAKHWAHLMVDEYDRPARPARQGSVSGDAPADGQPVENGRSGPPEPRRRTAPVSGRGPCWR